MNKFKIGDIVASIFMDKSMFNQCSKAQVTKIISNTVVELKPILPKGTHAECYFVNTELTQKLEPEEVI